jgi:5-methylcytosine-specific restriction endonuclease McrA
MCDSSLIQACRDCGVSFHARHPLCKRCKPCQRTHVNAETSKRDKARRGRAKAAAAARAAGLPDYEPVRDNGHRCRSCKRVLWIENGRAEYHCHECRKGMDAVFACLQVVSLLADAVLKQTPECAVCGGWVPPWAEVVCGKACSDERGRQKTRLRYERATGVSLRPLTVSRTCRFCDAGIAATNTNGRGRSVCDACGLHRGDFKSRARLYGVPYTEVSRRSVFERDGWRCQLCGLKVLMKGKRCRKTRRLHPRTASLDHIIPMSKGGPHTELNVQCACLACNVRKNARMIGQRRIF